MARLRHLSHMPKQQATANPNVLPLLLKIRSAEILEILFYFVKCFCDDPGIFERASPATALY